MKPILREPKAQRWRAVAVLRDGSEALLCLGGSIGQVRETYSEPWFELLAEDVRKATHEIHLQKWDGLPDRGEWVTQSRLPLPTTPVLQFQPASL